MEKSWWQSKTMWLQLIAVVSLLIGTKSPAVSKFLAEYFSEVGIGWAVINMVLRAVTKKELTT